MRLLQSPNLVICRRLANHPSIILWSGNNENEGAIQWYPESSNNPILYGTVSTGLCTLGRARFQIGLRRCCVAGLDYYKLYVETVWRTVHDEDDSRPFWPSSPSNGVLSWDPFVLEWGNI